MAKVKQKSEQKAKQKAEQQVKPKVTKIEAKPQEVNKFRRFVEKCKAAWSRKKHQNKVWKVVLTIAEILILTAWALGALEISKAILKGALSILVNNFHVEFEVNATLETVLSAIVYVIDLVITLGVPALILGEKNTRNSLGLQGLLTWTDIGMGVIGFILSMIGALIVTALAAGVFPWIDMEQPQEIGYENISSFKDMMMAFLALVVIAPVAEEIVFRGWLYGKLRRHTWAIPAILLTSIAFGVAHGQWNVGITVGVMSVFMCLIREMTGTVYGGMIVHMLKNGLAFYMLFVYGM
jgi:membrane protease YdiL (CAAX protease family)